jgi:DNA-directed RNA polymerase II subunit RPB7
MFFVLTFEQPIIMAPSCLYKDLQALIKAKLIEKVLGSVSEKYGYIVCVIKVDEPTAGKILDTSGDVLFNVRYKAVVMKPFPGEVVDGVIEKVDKWGVHVEVGPIKVFISNSNFPIDFEYCENQNCYISKSQNDKLSIDTEIRFRILNVQFESNNFHPTGTMNEDYLGPLR